MTTLKSVGLTDCPRCHRIKFGPCHCKGFYYWLDEDLAEEAQIVYADDIETAAEEAMQDWHIGSGDYDTGTFEVWLKPIDSGPVQKFEVQIDLVLAFSASPA